MTQSIGAIVLAAGASSRFGTNKLLLPFDGSSVVNTVMRAVCATDLAYRVVVTGFANEAVRGAIHQDCRYVVAHNADHLRGEMLSSVKCGLAQLQAQPIDAALIVMGDMPLVRVDLLNRVIGASRASAKDIVAPRYAGERGHPVLIARKYWSEILALPSEGNPREVLRRYPDALLLLDTDDVGVVQDVDTREKYDHAIAILKKRQLKADD
jgi:molybdenum cofactor cytidylyltransferase